MRRPELAVAGAQTRSTGSVANAQEPSPSLDDTVDWLDSTMTSRRATRSSGVRQGSCSWTRTTSQGARTGTSSPDGRFLMITQRATSASPELVIVLNWGEELTRLVPVD